MVSSRSCSRATYIQTVWVDNVKRQVSWVVVQVAIQNAGFFEEAGLLWAKLYHYRFTNSLLREAVG